MHEENTHKWYMGELRQNNMLSIFEKAFYQLEKTLSIYSLFETKKNSRHTCLNNRRIASSSFVVVEKAATYHYSGTS